MMLLHLQPANDQFLVWQVGITNGSKHQVSIVKLETLSGGALMLLDWSAHILFIFVKIFREKKGRSIYTPLLLAKKDVQSKMWDCS